MKHRAILILCFVAWLSTTCRHEPEPVPFFEEPFILLVSTDSTIWCDTLLDAASAFAIAVRAKSDSLLTLSHLEITRDQNIHAVTDTMLTMREIFKIFHFCASQSSGTEKWQVRITDSEGKTAGKELWISTVVIPLFADWIRQPGFISAPAQVRQGEIYTIGIIAHSQGIHQFPGLKHLRITREYRNITEIISDSAISGQWLMYSKKFTSPWQDRTDKYVFTVIDNRDSTITLTNFIYTIYNDTLTEEYTGRIWNALGDSSNGWDLVTNRSWPAGVNDLEKDMINSTVPPAEPPYYFEQGWYTGTTTRFIKPTHFDYENATRSLAIDAFTGGTVNTGLPYTWNVDSNNVFVARLRGGQEYAVIKIIRVVRTTHDHTDHIDFTYKK